MDKFLILLIVILFVTGCVNQEWVGVVYYKGNDPLHIGTFNSLEDCGRVTGLKAEGLGKFYEATCLQNCNYDPLVGQDVCQKAIDF